MKIILNLIFKICIALFWIVLACAIIVLIKDSPRSLIQIFNDFVVSYLATIVMCGLLSIILERFYKNFILKYFIISLFLISLLFFGEITAEFLGLAQSRLKGLNFTFDKLLFLYSTNFILFCLVCFIIYGAFKKNVKFVILGAVFGIIYILLYAIFYNHIAWSDPMQYLVRYNEVKNN